MQSLTANNLNLDDHVDGEIAACLTLEQPRSFFLYAGAGSGKTRSLVNALEHIREKHGPRLNLRGQRVAVVTYTNVASDEITRRLRFDRLFNVRTIHSFAWTLIEGFNSDIRDWIAKNLNEEIAELKADEEKGRKGTKASENRLARIESKGKRLANLKNIKLFIYSPTGDNRERNALNHSEVISMCAEFVRTKPVMQQILINQYPFVLVDESQDTNKLIVDALLAVQAANADGFSLGFIGDTMQRIYNDGKERIEEILPETWVKPAKRLNHRCPKRIVRLINKIRSQVDTHFQEPRSDAPEGLVRLFLFPSNTADKPATEDWVRGQMAQATGDEQWNDRGKCKILTLEHHMAARRMGFSTLFESLSPVDGFRTGLLNGELPATRFFTKNVLPLVSAAQRGDEFAIAKVVREKSPLLSADALKESEDQLKQIAAAKAAVDSLMKLWEPGIPTVRSVLEKISSSGLFVIPDSLKVMIADRQAQPADDKAEAEDVIPEEVAALDTFLGASFAEIEPYARYVSEDAEFGTHQGVKGREFDRVMVVMDDEESRGFMFQYDKLFGAEAQSATDKKNQAEGKETSMDRTLRLFYVTCSRAKGSLALVAYSSAPSAIRQKVIQRGWFDETEIVMSVFG